MTKYLPILFTFIVGFILIWLFVNVKSGHEREMNRLIQERDSALHKMNNERSRAEEWRQRALEYGNAFRAEATRATKSENRLAYEIEENRRLRNRPVVRYTDHQLDSALSARYPK